MKSRCGFRAGFFVLSGSSPQATKRLGIKKAAANFATPANHA
jgi:hypothetical protein